MAITGAPGRFRPGLRILTPANRRNSEPFPDEVAFGSSESVFGFLEGSEDSPGSCTSDEVMDDVLLDNHDHQEEVDHEDECYDVGVVQANKDFWENQHKLLQASLCRTTILETGIRNATREALKEIKEEDFYCKCGRKFTGNDCRFCVMREVSSRLREAGYNCAVCRSKWGSSPDISSGKHTYLDVIDNSTPKKGEIRVIIELKFRAEFEMARASQDYDQLINRLPEVFVGKVERLRAMVKILCSAGKKCMKDKKMHMGPWRKHKYMQAKWFSPSQRLETDAEIEFVFSKIAIKPSKASTTTTTMALLNVDVPHKALYVM